ncbi:hypothetical protein D1AOALGA4SA_2502 [Olavius algarvensis Delta 1 endosymbiont]|nr:hypothetical protein D1AOALGA4SA_2502 [Olavius algarvensis Delta 1 endosymbiont]
MPKAVGLKPYTHRYQAAARRFRGLPNAECRTPNTDPFTLYPIPYTYTNVAATKRFLWSAEHRIPNTEYRFPIP